jgi:hypothetical protein
MKNDSPPAAKGLQRDPARERRWRGLLKQFAASGQSIRRFCAARRLKETAFYFWRREIERRDAQAPARRSTRHKAQRPVSFAQAILRPATTGGGLTLRLGAGRELLLPATMAVEQVAKLVHALEGVA